MTLPVGANAAISFAQIQAEYGGTWSFKDYYRTGSYVDNTPSNYGVPTAGVMSFSQFNGGRNVVAGSFNRTSNGSGSVAVGEHNWLRVRVWGAGGGGAGYFNAGSAGSRSIVDGICVATGGKGGQAAPAGMAPGGVGSSGNVANLNGADGTTAGGKGAQGGAGGAYGAVDGGNGSEEGGGGGGGGSRGGGGGGYSHWLGGVGGPVTLTWECGNGGAGGEQSPYSGGNGADGRVLIEWG
jgi:Predicted membrane protein